MSIGRSLLITFALLAYLGQLLAFAVPTCESMSDTVAGVQLVQATEAVDSSHSQVSSSMELSSPMAEAAGGDCCESDCQCPGEGCHSPIPAVTSNGDTLVFNAVAHVEQPQLSTINTFSYLYKPPILS